VKISALTTAGAITSTWVLPASNSTAASYKITVAQIRDLSTTDVTAQSLIVSRSKQIANGTDLDTLTTGGFYGGSALVNAPFGSGWHWVQVQSHVYVDTTYAYQFAVDFITGKAAFRKRYAGTWSAWEQLWTSVSFPFATQVDAETGTNTTKPVNSLRVAQAIAALSPVPAKLSTASGSAPSYSLRAFIAFDGTGTPAILAAGNVTSITDNGTGDYTLNFTTAMPDANYATAGMGIRSTGGDIIVKMKSETAPTTSAVRIGVTDGGGIAWDASRVAVMVAR
jgi:hypothetical protein